MSSWTRDEAKTLIDAVRLAPSVHNSQPWALELTDHHALLFERRDIALPHHDPTGRDRLLSCGAALANLELAVRFLGRRAETALLGDPLLPDWVATVTAGESHPPTGAERARFTAIARRRSYRLRFSPQPLSDKEIGLITASTDGRVGIQRISGAEQVHALAGFVEHATSVFRGDRAYQRELLGWTTHLHDRRVHTGIPHERLDAGLRFGGLVRRGTPAADVEVIADSIEGETVLVLFTEGDSRREHLLAGASLQRAWLEATALGLSASVITQPLHLSEVRNGLAARLELPGRPHALLRLGTPTHSVPAAPRKPAHEFVLEGRS
ncbi:nitroreductase family protein [Allokutzneria sp. NRRL B-24872]|uniref:Acg family FMN-binding oxidoreductase n=1 Tax=Allokutzneria sp. NRRL B-24872 TaxID=1137961 RepID=UPI00143D607E|nr:nitroreductase family protein [Allokutzneria sp. NRRL B-24872]